MNACRRDAPLRRSAWAGGLLLLAAAVTPLGAAVDPFYTSRLQEGIAAVERGAYPDAVRSLRIACFGMLDDEPQLADCLVRLALAHAAAGDQEGFSQTFRRLVEGEELVGLYSKAGLPDELTRRFETKVVEWIPRAALATSKGFQRLAADQRESQLAALAPKARRERLAKLEKEEPKLVRWPLLTARLEKEQGQAKAALAAAERALKLAPDLEEARCLRGWGRAGTGKYAEALADLAGCRSSDPAFALAELNSRVELRQWREAEGLLATFTVEQRKIHGVDDLAKRVERALAQPAPRTASPVAGEEAQRTAPPAEAQRGSNGRPPKPAPTAAPTPTPAARAATLPMPTPAPAARPPAAAAPTPTPAAQQPPVVAKPTPTPTPAPAASPAPIGGALAGDDERTLARAQELLSRARTAAEIEEAYAVAADLATRYPVHQRVQHTAAEIAYRASRWSDAVRHFRRGGDPGEAQPLLLFYFAVSLWESGAHAEAQTAMRRCDGLVRQTPFVKAYRDKILGPAGS